MFELVCLRILQVAGTALAVAMTVVLIATAVRFIVDEWR